jgi:hypothetical protein
MRGDTVKWTDAPLVPAERRPRGPVETLVAELEAHPGRWAEVGRYPVTRRSSAYSRGSMATRRFEDRRLEYVVKREGDQFVLYYRVAP